VFLRYQIFLTKIWVESIGAGGGSIVWIDPETGLLKVGPQALARRPILWLEARKLRFPTLI
jgi:N-methylhydantoinase A/oxoprolinase/acetone carboxylase beta subunit